MVKMIQYPDYHDSLVCPGCLQKGSLSNGFFICLTCNRKFKIIDGVPIFVNSSEEYIDKRGNTNPTNPYPQKVIDLAVNNPDALILDFGAGCPRKEHMFNNILRLDYEQYYNTHVVSTNRNLPF